MREATYLLGRYRAIGSAVGAILLLASLLLASPLLVLLARPQESAHAGAFLWPAAALVFVGAIVRFAFRGAPGDALTVREGGVIVVASWLIVMLASAWPYASILDLSYSRALFESVSGWTTTGLTVVDVSEAGPMLLLWRSLTQFAGGAGWAILMVSAIAGPTGTGVASAEGRRDQLVPQVRRSARLVLVLYAAYASLGIVAYLLAGMPAFDALNHALAAVSTGGFSTRAQSIGAFDSLAIEGVTVALMVLGSVSFLTAWKLLRGDARAAARSSEIRYAAVAIPVAVAALFLGSTRLVYPQLGEGLRVAAFETISALTTSGFTIAGTVSWNGFGLALLVGLMTIGGGHASTAGGLKQYRVVLLAQTVLWEFRKSRLPRSVVVRSAVWDTGRRVFVDDRQVRQVATFVFVYLAAFGLGVLVLTASGFGLEDAIFEFASALGTVGLSLGATSADMPDPALAALTLAMFLGRLEFMVVITSLVNIAADVRSMLRGDDA